MTLAYRSALISGMSSVALLTVRCHLLALFASLMPSLTAAFTTKYSTTKNTMNAISSSAARWICIRVISASSPLQFMFSLPGLSCPFLAHSGRF